MGKRTVTVRGRALQVRNPMARLLASPQWRNKVERSAKGQGSYSRKGRSERAVPSDSWLPSSLARYLSSP